MVHKLSTIKKHILGPYWVKSVDGDCFVVNNILDLYDILPYPIFSKRFNFNGCSIESKVEDEIFYKPNLFVSLRYDLEYCPNDVKSLLILLNHYITNNYKIINKEPLTYRGSSYSFFTITHMIHPDLLEGMNDLKISRLIQIAKRNKSETFNVFLNIILIIIIK